jgi:hypothetical protein
MTGCYIHGKWSESLNSMKGKEFLDDLKNCSLSKDFIQWS